jgi:multiple sugar transport system ATP-binding protein
MGVRPEHLAQGHAIGDGNLQARVEVLEQLGSEMLAEVLIGEARLTVARIDPQTSLAAGDAITLSVPPERLHFFDPATEKAIR